jgi:DNA-binding MarR family transcriptional regulator
MEATPFDVMHAWMDLMNAINAWDGHLRRRYGLGGMDLAIIRITGASEVPGNPLGAMRMAELRTRLGVHPATFGQAVDRLVKAGWLSREVDPKDRRARVLHITDAGRKLLAETPLAGPVSVLFTEPEPERLGKVAEALGDAIKLFRLDKWAESDRDEEGQR